MYEKLKSFLLNDHIFFGLIIVLVGIGSFGLGRASVGPNLSKTIESNPLKSVAPALQGASSFESVSVPPVPIPTPSVKEDLVASKTGTKYHLTNCGGAKQIKPENKIFFSSRSEAEAAGYKPAANCPGLQ
jgi:Metal binding domain of Ada